MQNKILVICIILFGLINVYWFWPGSLYFLNDDLLHIPLTDKGYFFQTNSVRPVHELLVKLDLQIWGKNAYGYHLTALLLHFVVCILLYHLCLTLQLNWLKIDKPQAVQASLLAVLLVLAYPQSSESLAWIIGRAPILAAVFLLLTVRLFFESHFTLRIYLFAAFFFAAALFTYEQIVLLPAALSILAFAERGKVHKRKMFTFVAVLSVVAIAYTAVRKLLTSEVVGNYEGGNFVTLNWGNLVANAFRVFIRLWLNPGKENVMIFSIIVFLLLMIGGCIFFKKKTSINKIAVIFFAAIIMLFIVPVISLGVAVNSFESGRFLYLPSIFLISGISIGGIAVFHQNNHSRFFFYTVVIFSLLLDEWEVQRISKL